MTTQNYPSNVLPTQTFSVFRLWNWKTRLTQAESTLERRQADQPVPRSEWTLKYDVLREKVDNRQVGGGLGDGLDELNTLMGFYLQQNGPRIPFLFTDPTDGAVTGGPLGIGNGSTRAFQLVRQLGSLASAPIPIPPYFEPIQSPITVSAVYLNASPVGGWTVEAGGFVVFTSAPGNGVAVSADFTYSWLVRFSDPKLDLRNFMFQLWDAQTVKLRQCFIRAQPTG